MMGIMLSARDYFCSLLILLRSALLSTELHTYASTPIGFCVAHLMTPTSYRMIKFMLHAKSSLRFSYTVVSALLAKLMVN
uniref:Putative secreted protein n=1 Tax=Anopheles darlingi TaxID=43151 RepID=A0A2M4DN30_ANODA